MIVITHNIFLLFYLDRPIIARLNMESDTCDIVCDGGEIIELEEIHGDDSQIVYIIDDCVSQVRK